MTIHKTLVCTEDGYNVRNDVSGFLMALLPSAQERQKVEWVKGCRVPLLLGFFLKKKSNERRKVLPKSGAHKGRCLTSRREREKAGKTGQDKITSDSSVCVCNYNAL